MKTEYNAFKNLKYKQTNRKINKLFTIYNILKNDSIIKQTRVNNIFSRLTICENKLVVYKNKLINSGQVAETSKIRIYAKNPEGKEIGTIHGIGLTPFPVYEIYNSSGVLILSGNCPSNLWAMNQYITIPAGYYMIKVTFNGIIMIQGITLSAGQTKTIEFNFVRKELNMYDFISSCYSEILEPYYQFNMDNPYSGESTGYYIQHMGSGASEVLLTAKPNGGYEGSAGINARVGDSVLPFLSTFDNTGYIQIQIDPPDDYDHFPTMEEYVLGESSKFHCSTIPYDEDGTAL